MASGLFVIALLTSLVILLGLYLLIRAEASSTTVTDRAAAERDARAFGGRNDSRRRE